MAVYQKPTATAKRNHYKAHNGFPPAHADFKAARINQLCSGLQPTHSPRFMKIHPQRQMFVLSD